jgi:nicotinamidase-related amidase
MGTLDLPLRYYRAYPQRQFLGHAVEQIAINPDRAAFVLVDVYGLGFSPEDQTPHPLSALTSWTAEQEKEVTVGRIKPALDAARLAGLPVVYVCNSAPKIALARSEFAKQLKRAFDMDIEELLAEDTVDPRQYHYGPSTFLKHSKLIEPQPGDYYVRKLYASGFQDTHLDKLLRHLDVKTLIFAGYAADVCLLCTMIDAMNLNYEVILLRDCTLADIERLPGEPETCMGFTERMVLWVEMNVGRSTTSQAFVHACQAVSDKQRQAAGHSMPVNQLA